MVQQTGDPPFRHSCPQSACRVVPTNFSDKLRPGLLDRLHETLL